MLTGAEDNPRQHISNIFSRRARSHPALATGQVVSPLCALFPLIDNVAFKASFSIGPVMSLRPAESMSLGRLQFIFTLKECIF